MQLGKTHKFFLTLPGAAEVRVYPLNESLTFAYKKSIGDLKRKELETELVFTNTEEHATFDELFILENSRLPCIEMQIRIEQYCRCDSSVITEEWTGLIPFRKGKWDRLGCTVRVKAIPVDTLKCLADIWNTKKNILDLPNRSVIKSLSGGLQHKAVRGENPPEGLGWTLRKLEQHWDTFLQKYISTQTFWVRQFALSDLGGYVFDTIVGIWVKNVPMGEPKFYVGIDGASINDRDEDVIEVEETIYKIIDIDIDNAVTLSDALNFLIDGCGVNLVSNFFGINPDLTAPDNKAYRYAADYMQDVLLIHASDLINADATENATIHEISLDKIMKDFNKMFLKLYYKEETNTIYLEHLSYNTSLKKINLTKVKDVAGINQYEYVEQEFPKKESFKFAYDTSNRDFDGANFEYNSNCVNQDSTNNEIDLQCEILVANVGKMYNNDSFLEDDEKLFKTAIVAKGASEIISIGGVYTSNILNGPFAYTNILSNLGTYERPLEYGKTNGIETRFDTVKKQRKQNVSITLGCKTLIEELNSDMQIQTSIGECDIDEIKITKPSGKTELSLRG